MDWNRKLTRGTYKCQDSGAKGGHIVEPVLPNNADINSVMGDRELKSLTES